MENGRALFVAEIKKCATSKLRTEKRKLRLLSHKFNQNGKKTCILTAEFAFLPKSKNQDAEKRRTPPLPKAEWLPLPIYEFV